MVATVRTVEAVRLPRILEIVVYLFRMRHLLFALLGLTTLLALTADRKSVV